VKAGILTADEIGTRSRSTRRRPARGRRRVRASWSPAARRYAREIAARPAFAVGQTVTTRNHQPAGHTRLPAYVRCRRGTVVRAHGGMVFPDDNALGRGENPQHLYTVRFDARTLWGASAEPGTFVHVDLFESYLEPA
jgi:nitrile hydratase